MKYWLVLLLCIPLQSCYVDVPSNGGENSDNNSGVAEQEAGTLITSLTVTKGTTPDGDFPVAALVNMRGVFASQYELRLDGELLESGNMPGTAIVTGPFSGITTTDNYRLSYITIGSAGDHTLELKITKNGESETRTSTINVGNQCSGENENWFAANVQSSFDECTGCHTQAPNNNSFAELKTWDKIVNSGNDIYFVAHSAARLDVMPEANGGSYSHSDGRRWTPGSDAHLRVIEMLYRMDADFICP